MKPSRKLEKYISSIDRVFFKFGLSTVLKSSLFKHDELSSPDWIKLNCIKDQYPDFSITISEDGIQIQIDRVLEAFDFGVGDFEPSSSIFSKCFEELISNRLKINYLGSSIITIQILGSAGNVIRRIRNVEGLPWSFRKEEKSFAPFVGK